MNDRAGYSTPIIMQQAGRPVLVCWTGDAVVGLSPASGELYWRFSFPPKEMVLAIASPVLDSGRLFFTGFFDGSLIGHFHTFQSLSCLFYQQWRRGDRCQGDAHSIECSVADLNGHPHSSYRYIHLVPRYEPHVLGT